MYKAVIEIDGEIYKQSGEMPARLAIEWAMNIKKMYKEIFAVKEYKIYLTANPQLGITKKIKKYSK